MDTGGRRVLAGPCCRTGGPSIISLVRGRCRCMRRHVVALLLLAGGLALPLTPARALSDKDHAAVRSAVVAADAGAWRRAFAIAGEIDDPLLAKTLRWLRMVQDEGSESFADMANFLIRNPDWPLAERFQVVAENRITDPVDHALVRALFEGREPLTTRGHIRLAQALFEIGEDERAAELIRRAWVDGDFSRSEQAKFYQAYSRILTEADHVERLDNLLWDYRRTAATWMLDRVPEDMRKLADARLRLQRQAAGVDQAIRRVPGSLRSDPGLIFDRLRWRRQRRMHDGATQLLLDPPAELQRAERWWFEREFQLRRALRDRDFDLAYQLASRHGQTEGEDFAEAEWLAGWLALRFEGQPRTAIRHFERMYQGVERPISQARAAYWAGRAADAVVDRRLAKTWYDRAANHPSTFYGQLALEALGEPARTAPVVPTTAAQRLAFESHELVRVVRMLGAGQAWRDMRPFLVRLIDHARTPADVRMIAGLAGGFGRPDLMVLVGKYASYAGFDDEAAAFPVPDYATFQAPPADFPELALVLGVARQESLFDPQAGSHAGARGLLQLMPSTARLVAKQLGVPYNIGLLTGDPEYNLRLGGAYLGRVVDRYGDLGLALAAYNAGPSRVDGWLRLHGDPRKGSRLDWVDWMELIPFDETRNYVQRVLENYRVYQRLLEEQDRPRVEVAVVAGPIEPVPIAARKPLPVASAVRLVALGFGPIEEPPQPALKPVAGPVIIPAGFSLWPLPVFKPGPEDLATTPPAANPDLG